MSAILNEDRAKQSMGSETWEPGHRSPGPTHLCDNIDMDPQHQLPQAVSGRGEVQQPCSIKLKPAVVFCRTRPCSVNWITTWGLADSTCRGISRTRNSLHLQVVPPQPSSCCISLAPEHSYRFQADREPCRCRFPHQILNRLMCSRRK